jgi:flagellar basal-body rod modification protein FlgD
MTPAMTQISQITSAGALPLAQDTTRTNSLGQQDFLTLLTAQLKNQDPLKPLENTEFLGQMAQFSTVAGVDRLNETLGGYGAGLRDMRIAMASNMLGHSVLVPGPVARPDAEGAIRGAVDLPEAVDSLVVTYADARTGAILHAQTLGAQPAGLTGFEWADLPPALVADRTAVRVSLSARGAEGGAQALDPKVYARVLSASAGAQADDVTLQVEGFGALNTLEIESFR